MNGLKSVMPKSSGWIKQFICLWRLRKNLQTKVAE